MTLLTGGSNVRLVLFHKGIPGPKACEVNARFRRFAFTAKDMELSQGASGNVFGNTGLPFTPVKVETVGLGAERVWVVKFGDDVRTVLSNPLIYMENERNVTVPDGDHTICHVEEVVGDRMGDIPFSYDGVQLQLLLGDDRCTSSFTDRECPHSFFVINVLPLFLIILTRHIP